MTLGIDWIERWGMVKIAIFPFRFGLWAGLESGSWIFEPLTLPTAVQVTWFEGLGDEGAIEWNTEKCIRKSAPLNRRSCLAGLRHVHEV